MESERKENTNSVKEKKNMIYKCQVICRLLKARVLKSYPSKLNFTALQCLLSCMQSFVVAVAFEREADEWRLGWNIRLLAVAYCGIVVTGFTYYLQTWVIEKKGPVFLALSTPLAFVFTIISSALLLGEIISFGSVIGGILLIGGLYSVLWGKSKEEEEEERCDNKVCLNLMPTRQPKHLNQLI